MIFDIKYFTIYHISSSMLFISQVLKGRAMNTEDDQELPDIPEEEKRRIVSALIKMMEMGMGAVYGDEDDGIPDADVDCGALMSRCRAKCCTLTFALTRDEVEAGNIRYNLRRPYFIARDEDGYCPHLDRSTFRCSIWERRPLRCRRYSCTDDPVVWPNLRKEY